MRRLTFIAAGLFALGALAQEPPDAGFGLSTPDPTVAPVPVPEPAPVPEPVPVPEPQPAPVPESAPVTAPEPAPPPPPFAHLVEANGYAALRGAFTRSRFDGLLPTDDQPQLSALLELNGQLKVKYAAHGFLYGDVSLIGQAAGNFRGADVNGKEVVVAEHQVPANIPAVSLNELYLLHEFRPELNVLVGKKRLVWGSGQAYNPADLFNLRKDPTDPTFQRAGAWMARVEVPLEKLAFTAVFAPAVTKAASGLPQQFLTSQDPKDDQLHYQAALRAYALIADADVNLMLFYGNQYNDAFSNKLRVGGSFSRYFFTDYELHTEFLIQTGSARDFVNHDCTVSALAALACANNNQSFVSKPLLTDGTTFMPKLLVGSRRQFDDESFLSVEYLYQADGYTAAQYQDFVNGLDLIQQAKAAGVPANRIPSLSTGTVSADGVTQRFNFDPLAQHYLFITFNKPRIKDDFTAQLVTIANLQDLSTLWTPSLSWSTTEWLTLTAIGFIPVPGPDSLAAKRLSNNHSVSEESNLPLTYRILLEARVFY